jgi:hypothetical protein
MNHSAEFGYTPDTKVIANLSKFFRGFIPHTHTVHLISLPPGPFGKKDRESSASSQKANLCAGWRGLKLSAKPV